jgi:hypothetical protein
MESLCDNIIEDAFLMGELPKWVDMIILL